MKLGILITTDRHLNDVIGITKAALSAGHEVMLFAMDEGVKFLQDGAYRELSRFDGVTSSYCDYSTMVLYVSKEGVPEEVVCGSQYHNVTMMRDADRVIKL